MKEITFNKEKKSKVKVLLSGITFIQIILKLLDLKGFRTLCFCEKFLVRIIFKLAPAVRFESKPSLRRKKKCIILNWLSLPK